MEVITCSYCEKKIKAFTKSQAEYLLKQHIIAKHMDKVKFEEKIKGEDK